LTDPQTSGGLLVSCDANTVDEVLDLFRREGFAHAAVIGEMVDGPARVDVGA
jgi:selenide, water dikinase